MEKFIFTDQNFESEVLKGNTPVVIDFWAEWCAPCRVQSPIIEALAKDIDSSKVKIGTMNVDENANTPQKYGIMSIPTLILFKNGEAAEQLIGLQTKEKIEKVIQKYIS